MPLVSIIIRTKNEERWITSCLQAIFSQEMKDFEVILVDNVSEDKTVEKASRFPLAKIVTCEKYKPGLAINIGVRASSGKYIVCISGHCIPTHNKWLSNFVANFKDSKIAGVYGRQQPLSFTPDADKRDLSIVFGLDRKVQERDSFFHNANSMIRRDLWEKFPFDEEATNIEDRIWGKQMIDNDYRLVYEPEASVYHYHGIHQDGNPERCANVVRILESIDDKINSRGSINAETAHVVALIPYKGKIESEGERTLFEITVKDALRSQFISEVIVATDEQETAQFATSIGAAAPFLRDKSFSSDFVSVEEVLQYSLLKLEEQGILPDVLVTLETSFPLRPKGMIDDMIRHLLSSGLDTVIAGKKEHRGIWKHDGKTLKPLGDLIDVPRKFKEPTFITYRGLGCVTHPQFLRGGSIFGPRVGIFEFDTPLSEVEIRDWKTLSSLRPLVKKRREELG